MEGKGREEKGREGKGRKSEGKGGIKPHHAEFPSPWRRAGLLPS